MVYIDSHTHNYDEAYPLEEQDAVIARAVGAGVEWLLQPDVSSAERDRMWDVVNRHPDHLKAMLGLYPGSVDKNWKTEIDALERYKSRDIIAIGEIGLDYHFSVEFKEEQKEALRVQLEMAASMDLPVNIHLRDATGDFMQIIRDCRHLGLRGNLHAFSESIETFRELQKLGDWSVGIGGVVTFKKASLAETIKEIPLSRILLETDSPYLAPTPLRGTTNESANIPVIAQKIAELKACSIEEVARTTTENARKLFRI